MENKTTNNNENKSENNIQLDLSGNIPLDLTGLPADLTCDQEELKRWLDLVPPTDDEIEAMSVYFDAEKLKQHEYVLLPSRIEDSETDTSNLEMPEYSVGKALLKGMFIAIAIQIAFHTGLSLFMAAMIVTIVCVVFSIAIDSFVIKRHKKTLKKNLIN